jgi:hypothetical protein
VTPSISSLRGDLAQQLLDLLVTQVVQRRLVGTQHDRDAIDPSPVTAPFPQDQPRSQTAARLTMVCGGESPFHMPGAPATMHAVAYEEPVLSGRLGPLRPVIEELLRKSPQERPSAAAARSALQGIATGETDAAMLPPSTVRELRPLAPSADADTMTGSVIRPVPTGTADTVVPTTGRDTASLPPSLPQPSRPASPKGSAGPKRLWWALAGTAVLAASVAGGLFLTGVLPLKDDPKPDTTSQVVRSTAGWQTVADEPVHQGDRITVQFVSGEWTANYRKRPVGYDAETDRLQDGVKACKVKGTAPFAALLARLGGGQDFPVHVVGRKLTFRANGDASLQLAMNDAAGVCSQDNRRCE